ncbi:MAG: dihydropteroate synthase [Kiritimatiellae bacterium]|nr:dihydropteroate synthase [Kiritimatiellia bacterium]
MQAEKYEFRGKRFCFSFPSKTLIMGVLNVTPDSFSDGGQNFLPDAAVASAKRMQDDGADIIDVGAMSTAPGRMAITPCEEIRRLSPVLSELEKRLKIPVSVDTVYPETARFALQNGAAIINDVSGVFNPATAAVVKEYGAGLIITHGGSSNVTKTHERDIIGEVSGFFGNVLKAAELCGIDTGSVCLDPGIGFGKSREEDALLLRCLSSVKQRGAALLVGVSRKRLIGEASGESDPSKRDFGTVAAHTAAIAGGADIIRAHNVFAAVQGARVADAIYRRKETFAGGKDKIIIKGLNVFAYHGVNPEEKRDGQNFLIDIEIFASLYAACVTDSVNDTVSYSQVIKSAVRIFTAQKYDLIERAAEALADGLLDEYPSIDRLTLTIKKPDAPMKAVFDFVGTEITRERR